MQSTPNEEKDIFRSSRILYIFEAMFEYFISLLTTGAYLAKLTSTIGISDSMTAVLSSVTSLAGMFQIISIFLSHKLPVKRWVVPITLIAQVCVSMLYVIPFLNLGAIAPIIFFAIMLINSAGKNVVSPAKSNWFLTLVEDKKRGDFQAKITIVSLAGGMIFTLTASTLMDTFEAKENITGAFIVMTVAICVLTVFQFACLLFAKEKPAVAEKKSSPFSAVGTLLKNKVYKRFIVINFLWAIAANVTNPFLSTFQIKELGFSMTFISGVGIVLNILQMVVVYFFGRYSVRHSYSSILRISYVFASVAFLFVALSTPQNGYVVFTLYRLVNVFYGAANAVSATSLLFNIVPPNDRTSAIAVNTIISGATGFCVTLIISPILNLLQSLNISLFGIQIYAQQILALASLVLTLVILLYYQLVCHKHLKNN